MSAPAWAIAPGRPSLRTQRIVADGAVLLFVAAWLASSRAAPAASTFPDPARVLPLAIELLVDPRYAPHTLASFARVLAAVAIALVLGTALMLAARFLYVSRILIADRLLPLLNAFPSVGWAIVAVVWFGVSDGAVVAVMVAILLPFTMINVWNGLLTLDEELYEMARSFGRDRLRRLRLLVLPALLPQIVASARISYGIGWKVGIVAELFGVTTGLGYLMSYARTVFDTALLYAAIVVIVAFVFAVDRLVFDRLERLLTRHRAETVPALG